jgi:hypothetical protein
MSRTSDETAKSWGDARILRAVFDILPDTLASAGCRRSTLEACAPALAAP